MKKAATILLLIILTGIVPVFAAFADESAENPVEYHDFRRLTDIEEEVGFAVAVLISSEPRIGRSPYEAEKYAREYYFEQIGRADGIILFINNSEKTGNYLIYDAIFYHNLRHFDEEWIESVLWRMSSDLENGNFDRAIKRFGEAVVKAANSGKIGWFSAVVAMVIAGTITGIAVVFGVRRSYKIRPAKCADGYLVRDSAKYRQRTDTFIRQYVTKIKIQSSTSGSGGSSSGSGSRGR
jgi:uncharacterized membrane protein YgcG